MNTTLKIFALKYIPGVRKLRDYRNKLVKLLDAEKRLQYCESYILAEKTSELLRGLQPHISSSFNLMRVGKDSDGGYVMADLFSNIDAAYSFGIANDVSWDRFIAEKGIPVFMYDHTISGLPEDHRNFNFFKIGICGKPNQGGMKDIGELMRQNGHLGKNLIMKMDIEGYEYPAIDAMTDEELSCFTQITCEIHELQDLINNFERHQLISRCIRKILTHMHCVHVHANNVGWVAENHGVKVPVLLELTFVRKDMAQDFVTTNDLRKDLDRENNPDLPTIDISNLWMQTRGNG